MSIFETNNKEEIQKIEKDIINCAIIFNGSRKFCGKSKQLPFDKEQKLSAKLMYYYGADISYEDGGYYLVNVE